MLSQMGSEGLQGVRAFTGTSSGINYVHRLSCMPRLEERINKAEAYAQSEATEVS